MVRLDFSSQMNANSVSLIGSIISSAFVYFVLSYLLVAPRITIAISIGMSILIFGLTRYYLTSTQAPKYSEFFSSKATDSNEIGKSDYDGEKKNEFTSGFVFVVIYSVLIAICTLGSKPDSHIFVIWSQIGALGIIQLAASIMLCFFIPGYAIMLIISKKYMINPVLMILISYIISMLFSGGTEYILGLYSDSVADETKNIIIGTHIILLIAFIICYPVNRIGFRLYSKNSNQIKCLLSHIVSVIFLSVKSRSSELLVFGSILMLLIISSYGIFGGITIGDQWFHQGRALLFMSGSFRDIALSGADDTYPPFQSALLASLTILSGNPMVNTYVSVAFLSIIPVFAFYYFFSKWVPSKMQKANILASSLFATSSGFGWIYLIALTLTSNPIHSLKSVVETIAGTEPFDIVLPTNFILAAHPDINTGLIYIALPAGFILLGLLREQIRSNLTFTIIITVVLIVGSISHPEFYLFTIICSILPIIFRINKGNYVYLALLLSFLVVYAIDLLSPVKYILSIELFGFPLLGLNILFIIIMWPLYLVRENLHRIQMVTIIKFKIKRLPINTNQFTLLGFVFVVLAISLIAYFYGLSVIVWNQISFNDIKIQASGYNVPWYFYPLKVGLTGILALAFVLSYFFKRFQKEILVFGVIIVTALVVGPYYDEHRFSKYIMAGLVAFASLLIYRILGLKSNKQIVVGIVIGATITFASLSSILFLGYNSLIVQSEEFHQTLGRRNFPTASEMPLFQTLHDKTDFGSGRYNIVSFPNEYNYIEGGFIAKLQAFSGLPNTKLYQSPLTLNASILDSFYQLLDYSDARYIVIPNNSINKKSELTEPLRFALDSFTRTYEDNKYIVLDVPDLNSASSSSGSNTALVYNENQKDESILSSILGSKLLQYDNSSFNFGGETNFVIIQEANKTKNAILSDYDSNKGLTIWSKEFDSKKRINYVEVEFKTIAENSNKSNDAGLKWKEGRDKVYHLSLTKKGLELSQESHDKVEGNNAVYQNVQIEKKDLVSYTLKLERLQNSTNIFLDDIIRIQIPRIDSGDKDEGISQVGISASNSTVEFGPIKIGNLSEKSYTDGTKYNAYYYPLSISALSKSNYDIFMDTDFSALSKKQLILASDPLELDDRIFNRYLDYASKGGTLIVMNSDDFNGTFAALFSLDSNGNKTEMVFTKITGQNNQSLNVSGLVKPIEMNLTQDENIISAYKDKADRMIAPFAIEKHFPNGGRIVLVNSEAYFKALSNSPEQYFLSLSNVPTLLDLNTGKVVPFESTADQAKRFIGDLNITGNVILKSSSLLIPESANSSQNIYADSVLITSKSNNQSDIFKNITINDIKLIGQYEITINSIGKTTLPNKGSRHEYISILTPTAFNMTVNLSADRLASAEIVTSNDSSMRTIEVNNDSIINFYKISTGTLQKSIPILLKSPEVRVNGHIDFRQSNFDPYLANAEIPLEQEGQLKMIIDHVDNYKQIYDNGTTKVQYITYLKSITTDRSIEKEEPLKLPGDISPLAKKQGLQLPLKAVLLSNGNVILIIFLTALAVIGSWLIWPKIKVQTEREHI